MQNLLNELTELLSSDLRLVSDGHLLKNKVVELALGMDSGLLALLISNKSMVKHFFASVGSTLIFDKNKFHRFVSNKAFLPDSYTSFKNKIGFSAFDDYLSESREVVLSWPYKDCVLEGGQTSEDATRKEVFWNEILAPDQIDRLLSPKALVKFQEYSADKKVAAKPSAPKTIDRKTSLLIKGNNLLALHSLKRYFGTVQLICIDPPYNTGKDSFNYNDSFNHSTWLTFMKNRLEVARELLHPNGSLFIFCDDVEHAYLKVLCDEIMGRKGYISTIVWKHSDNSNNDSKTFSTDHNFILAYSKNENWVSLKTERGEESASHYTDDGNPRGPWFDGNPLNSPKPRPNLRYTITAPNGHVIQPPPNGWRWDPETLEDKMKTGEIFFNKTNTGIKRITYLREQKALPPSSLWDIEDESSWFDLDETGHTRQAKSEQKGLFKGTPTSELFQTPKPERVIRKIIDIATKPGDLVVDFFSGSGTTAAVAMKMGRQFIAIEQMDYIQTFSLPRLQKVIAGEQGGISKDVEWKGGGSFVYCELAESNQVFVAQIRTATTHDELIAVWSAMKDSAFLSYRADVHKITTEELRSLSTGDLKRLLTEVLDKNMLYVPYSEIDDESYKISESDKVLNESFYRFK